MIKLFKHINSRRYSTLNTSDIFNLSSLLTEDEKMIQTAASSFAKSHLLPFITESFRYEKIDSTIIKKMGDAGLLGSTLEGYGCAGVSSVGYGLIAREIEKVDSAYRSALSVQSSLVMLPIYEFASTEIKNQYLPKLASGDLIGCFGLTEPNHGSDPSGMETKALWDEKKQLYILNGSKTWITNSPIADIAIVWARSNKHDNKVTGFIIPTSDDGISCPAINGKFSLRASSTGSILLDNVKVPESHRLKVEGMKGPFTCLNSARFGIAWGSLGAAEDCLKRTITYVKDRKQFNKPIGSNQLIQIKLANAITEISLGLNSVLRAGRMKDGEGLDPVVISLLKRNSCVKSLTIARDCRDILGGNGIVDEYGVIRHMLNLEAVNTYEGTADIHSLIIAKALTGLSSF